MKLRYLAMAAAVSLTAGCNWLMGNDEESIDIELHGEDGQAGGEAYTDEGDGEEELAASTSGDVAPAAEAGCQPPGALVGIWAAEGDLRTEFTANGRMEMKIGTRQLASAQYCVVAPGRAQLKSGGTTEVMEFAISADGSRLTSTNPGESSLAYTRVGG